MEKQMKKSYFILAASFFILCAIMMILDAIPVFIHSNVSLTPYQIIYIIRTIAIFTLGVSLLSRKINLVSTVALGVIFLAEVFSVIIDLPYILHFNFFTFFKRIVSYLFPLSSVAFLVVLSVISIKNSNSKVLSLWFIPVRIETICIIFKLYDTLSFIIGPFTYGGYPSASFMIRQMSYAVINIVYFLGIVFLGLAISEFSKFKSANAAAVADTTDTTNSTQSAEYGYCDMTKHVLLWIFIGWIWQYVWIYKTTKYLNITPDEEKRDPATKLLLCMLIPFYYIYWVYQSAKRIDILAKKNNIKSDITTLSVVFSLFIGIVPPIIMQNTINKICSSKKQTVYTQSPETVVQTAPANVSVADELRSFKQLLDDGIITQEEFDAKKKQLLNL